MACIRQLLLLCCALIISIETVSTAVALDHHSSTIRNFGERIGNYLGGAHMAPIQEPSAPVSRGLPTRGVDPNLITPDPFGMDAREARKASPSEPSQSGFGAIDMGAIVQDICETAIAEGKNHDFIAKCREEHGMRETPRQPAQAAPPASQPAPQVTGPPTTPPVESLGRFIPPSGHTFTYQDTPAVTRRCENEWQGFLAAEAHRLSYTQAILAFGRGMAAQLPTPKIQLMPTCPEPQDIRLRRQELLARHEAFVDGLQPVAQQPTRPAIMPQQGVDCVGLRQQYIAAATTGYGGPGAGDWAKLEQIQQMYRTLQAQCGAP